MKQNFIENLEVRLERLKKKNSFVPKEKIMAYKMMHHISESISEHIDNIMKEAGLQGKSWLVLMMIYNSEKEKIISTDLCETLSNNKSTMTRTIDALINKKLIEREYDKEDRRKISLKITSAGKTFINTNLTEYTNFMEKVWKDIDVKEISKNLKTIIKNLEPSHENKEKKT